MKKLVIFAGTTEGRRLSEILADAGIAHTVCVATEYGEIVMREQTESTKAKKALFSPFIPKHFLTISAIFRSFFDDSRLFLSVF